MSPRGWAGTHRSSPRGVATVDHQPTMEEQMHGYDNSGFTRTPSGETDYLAEAGKLLAKAAERNEQVNATYPGWLIEGRERIAGKYAELAAIQRGVLPADLAKLILDKILAEGGR